MTVTVFLDKFDQLDRLDNLVKITPVNLNNTKYLKRSKYAPTY